MKHIITLLVALIISIASFAQTGINYKAVIKDDLSNVVTGQPISVQFAILKGAEQTIQYSETHNPTTDANGIIVLIIGEGTQASGNYSAIDWGNDTHWLNVKVDIGSGLQDMGTIQFMAVPYALHAESGTFKTVNNVTSNSPGNLGNDNLVFGSTQMDDDNSTPDDNSRLFFNKSKSAFRAGYTFGDYWNDNRVGIHSAAFGYGTIASGAYSFAIGELNVDDPNARFMIGNGIDDSNRNNALSLFNNGSFLVGSAVLNNNPSSSTDDTRFFFNKPRGAFRAGFANGTQWDDANIGDYSAAFGFVTIASGARSTALGSGTKASGFASTAIGNYNKEDAAAYLIVGNGTGDTDRKNALVLKSNGDFILGSSQLEDDNTTVDDNARVFFDKSKGAFRAGLVDDTYWNDSEVGSYSVSLGLNTKAKGQNSFAMGGNSAALGKDAVAMGGIATASGLNAISIGNQTNANGITSVALGAGTTTNGYYSTAMNINTTADALGSTVIGQYNVGGGTFDDWIDTDPLFEIGNSEDSTNKSNALTVLKNGTVTAPSFDMSEITDPKALITKEYLEANGSGSTGLEAIDEGNGIGWRLAGRDTDNYGSIGINAIDLSYSSSTLSSFGATGNNSTAIGYETRSTGFASTAIGNNSIATGSSSLAMGYGTMASNSSSIAMGYGTVASGDSSTAMGQLTEASGQSSISIGQSTIASGDYSTAMGLSTIASGSSSLAIGKYNITDVNGLFMVGNGTGTSNRKNALVIKENGDAVFDAEIQHPSTGLSNMIPIAYGIVESNGNLLANTGNFTASVSSGVFTIDVNGTESLNYLNTVCIITPISAAPRTSSTIIADGNNDGDNDILVRIFNSSGSLTATTFQFVIYKE